MDVNTILFVLVALACPVAMGTMMWFMNRDMNHHTKQPMPDQQLPADPAVRLAVLRQQRQALEAEIAEVTRIVVLEAQQEQLIPIQIPPTDEVNNPTA